MDKEIKKIVKKAVKNISDGLMADDWFVSSSKGDIDCYERELEAILKKACKDVVQNGYKKGMVKDVIKETANVANATITLSISLYNDYYDNYKDCLEPYVKEALKSCDKLHESKKLYESSDLYVEASEEEDLER